ncbi:hypothetical protein ACWCP6_02840 [Streptomyces sp. NPDC002004]
MPEGSAGGRPLGEITGSFKPPLQVGQLALDASGAGRQEHGDTDGIAALVFLCKPSGGTERTSSEPTVVSWPAPEEVSEHMPEVFAIRVLDALESTGLHVRSHDGKHLIPAG